MIRLLGNLLAVALLCAGSGGSATGRAADDLIGIWRADVSFGPKLAGPLIVRRSASGYSATIRSEHATASPDTSDIRFSFGRNGLFRGHVSGQSLEGFWVQPNSGYQSAGDAGGCAQSYATPMRFQTLSSDVWRGHVRPLNCNFTLWLSIFKTETGGLAAAFRNPQLNSTGGAARFDVSRNGDTILFSANAGTQNVNYSAALLRNPDRIRIWWKDTGETIELTRRTGAGAAAFFARPPASRPYKYRRPPELGDGWKTARAGSVGIDEQALQRIVRDIASSDPTIRNPRLVHSLLVAHRGRLVLEEYFYGFDRQTPHDMRSATKTFASVLLGTDQVRAAGLRPETRIYDVMHDSYANPDARKSRITLANLMTHTSGLACDDNNDASPGNESVMQSQRQEPDWWRYTLGLPQLFDPGQRYAYCSANMNLVGAALTAGTHTWLPELFRKTVAEPLQFGEWDWNLMPTGEGYLGGGAFLLPRDFLKVGQMYLDGGLWNGRRIVPARWVEESTRPHVQVTPETTGLSEEEFGNFYIRGADGLAWHLGSLKAADRTYGTYSAVGNGGQLLIVVPEADLVVLFTGGNYGQGGVWLRWPQQIVGEKLLPAISR